MNIRGRCLIAVIIIVSLSLVAVIVFVTLRQKNLVSKSIPAHPPTTVHDRVVNVVQNWAHVADRPKDTDQLAVLWSPQASPFNPDGAQLLVLAIQKEFSEPPVVCKCITVGDVTLRIKTVADLVTAVPGCP